MFILFLHFCRGVQLSQRLKHYENTTQPSEYTLRYQAPPSGTTTAGSAPQPVDKLDGHLVFAHGTNITDRDCSPTQYLTV